MTRHRGGDDPTRSKAGGSRTETVITELSEQGTDNSSDGPPAAPKERIGGRHEERRG
jgi:hypothetical protein